MRLYGTPPTRALRVLWALREMDIECEVVTVNMAIGEHIKPELLALNPAGKLPVLVDGDVVLTESAAIPLYLAEKYPEKGLIPGALADRAQMYRWIFFLVSSLYGAWLSTGGSMRRLNDAPRRQRSRRGIAGG